MTGGGSEAGPAWLGSLGAASPRSLGGVDVASSTDLSWASLCAQGAGLSNDYDDYGDYVHSFFEAGPLFWERQSREGVRSAERGVRGAEWQRGAECGMRSAQCGERGRGVRDAGRETSGSNGGLWSVSCEQ